MFDLPEVDLWTVKVFDLWVVDLLELVFCIDLWVCEFQAVGMHMPRWKRSHFHTSVSHYMVHVEPGSGRDFASSYNVKVWVDALLC